MRLDNDILLRAVPALAVLFTAELVFLVKEHRHDKKDMITSLALAIGTIPISMITTGIIVFVYSFIYQYRVFTIPADAWWGWMIIFFGDDLSYYWYHRMSHEIRFFWASHAVHHSSTNFNLASGLRVPWTSNITGTFLFWAWLPFIGFEPAMVIAMKSISVIYQFWVHTEAIHKMPRWFEAIFNTPSHHRVHHACDVEYLDKNHAGTLIFWDKMFGTFKEESFKPTYGLTSNIKSFNPLKIVIYEWKNMLKDLGRSKSIRNRLNYLFRPPGWSHDGASKTTRQLRSEKKCNRCMKCTNCLQRISRIAVCMLPFLFFACILPAQERKLEYNVVRKGDVIGTLHYVELVVDIERTLFTIHFILKESSYRNKTIICKRVKPQPTTRFIACLCS